jgi:hypothetical protein
MGDRFGIAGCLTVGAGALLPDTGIVADGVVSGIADGVVTGSGRTGAERLGPVATVGSGSGTEMGTDGLAGGDTEGDPPGVNTISGRTRVGRETATGGVGCVAGKGRVAGSGVGAAAIVLFNGWSFVR